MKKIYVILSFILSINIGNGQGIDFVHVTWQEALQLAKEENRLLFVDAYAQWCGPCKRMAKNEFTKSDVGEMYNSNFVNLKLDMETPNGRTFGSEYPVSAYPTMFFLDGDGEVVKKIRGGKKGDQLISMAKEALRNHDTSGQFASKYEEGDRSFETVFSYVDALNKANKPSLKISNDYIKSNPAISDLQLAKFLHAATVDADSKIFERMVNQKSLVIESVGEEAYNKKVRSACRKTINKAIEFEFEDLYIEAIDKGKSSLTEGQKVYVAESFVHYHKQMNNTEDYLKGLKNLSKIYLKESPKKMQKLVDNLQKEYRSKEEMHPQVVSLSGKLFKKYKNAENAVLYSKALIMTNEFKQAEKVIGKGKKMAKENKSVLKQLEMLQKVIDKRKSSS